MEKEYNLFDPSEHTDIWGLAYLYPNAKTKNFIQLAVERLHFSPMRLIELQPWKIWWICWTFWVFYFFLLKIKKMFGHDLRHLFEKNPQIQSFISLRPCWNFRGSRMTEQRANWGVLCLHRHRPSSSPEYHFGLYTMQVISQFFFIY